METWNRGEIYVAVLKVEVDDTYNAKTNFTSGNLEPTARSR